MASLSHLSRPEKRRIASEIHDNLVTRKANGDPDPLLDPFIPKLAGSRDNLGEQVDEKMTALAQRAAALTTADIDDDEVDRWYRHLYRYTEVESLRRHAPEHASIEALLLAGYPEGLAHVDDRIPEQNDQVRRTLAAYRDLQHAHTIAAIKLPVAWIDALETAVAKSDASFAAYQATFSDASSAVALGRDAEADWASVMRGFDHAIGLRSMGASTSTIEESKRLIAPLANAIRLLRTESRTRATKRKTDESQ